MDPLSRSFPWNSPYSFANNNPIQNIDYEGLAAVDPKHQLSYYLENRPVVNMSNFSPTSTTATGAPRNSYQFWKEMYERYPSAFSKENQDRIFGKTPGAEYHLTPIIDEDWVKQFPNDAEFLESVSGSKHSLTHHHLDQGVDAIAIPKRVHQKWHKELHKVTYGLKSIISNGKVVKHIAFIGLFMSMSTIASAENKTEAIVKEGGSEAGSFLEGAAGGFTASWFTGNPLIITTATIAGSIAGGIKGENAAGNAVESLQSQDKKKDDALYGSGGVQVRCFVAGTKITMSDGTFKNIEDVKIGELVKTYNEDLKAIENKEVLEIMTASSSIFVQIELENNIINVNTPSHPYYVVNKGWASFDEKEATAKYRFDITKLEKGDTVYILENGKFLEVKIKNITVLKESKKTYNLSNIKDNHNFFANGILVHNKSN